MLVSRIANAVAALLGHGVGSVAMHHGEVEQTGLVELLDRDLEELGQRAILRPTGELLVDDCVVNLGLAIGCLIDR